MQGTSTISENRFTEGVCGSDINDGSDCVLWVHLANDKQAGVNLASWTKSVSLWDGSTIDTRAFIPGIGNFDIEVQDCL